MNLLGKGYQLVDRINKGIKQGTESCQHTHTHAAVHHQDSAHQQVEHIRNVPGSFRDGVEDLLDRCLFLLQIGLFHLISQDTGYILIFRAGGLQRVGYAEAGAHSAVELAAGHLLFDGSLGNKLTAERYKANAHGNVDKSD